MLLFWDFAPIHEPRLFQHIMIALDEAKYGKKGTPHMNGQTFQLWNRP